ncbi:MAG: hypothetical protein RL113_765 [Pseudomonadota bacterium]
MRKAFSMITAIFIILLMATVAAFIKNLSGKMVKGTTTQFQHEQAVLLARSYTEYAIMAVTANDHTNSGCLNNLSGAYAPDSIHTIYTVDVNLSYIGNSAIDGSCRTLSNGVVHPNSPLNVIIDVYVRYPELDHPLGTNAPKVTYHKRSLQKI